MFISLVLSFVVGAYPRYIIWSCYLLHLGFCCFKESSLYLQLPFDIVKTFQ